MIDAPAREADELRRRYAGVIDALLRAGRRDDARAAAELAVAQGLWSDPAQRPLEYVPGVPPRPVVDPAELWFVDHLEQHAALIRDELDRVAGQPGALLPVEEPLLDAGRWDQVVLYEAGRRAEEACARFPVTASVVEAIPEATTFGPGVVTLSWLHPGSHVVPHCGWSNGRLRVHLGLRVPPGARMRVADRLLEWEERHCLVFDDSFEHEVWHDGDEPRVVLLLDVLNPALDDATRERLLRGRASADASIRAYMLDHGLARIEARDDEVALYPAGGVEALVRRYMRETGATAVELTDGGLRYER